jgi:hypothetical protein
MGATAAVNAAQAAPARGRIFTVKTFVDQTVAFKTRKGLGGSN